MGHFHLTNTDKISLDEVEQKVEKIVEDVKQMNANLDVLYRNQNSLKELLHVLQSDFCGSSIVCSCVLCT